MNKQYNIQKYVDSQSEYYDRKKLNLQALRDLLFVIQNYGFDIVLVTRKNYYSYHLSIKIRTNHDMWLTSRLLNKLAGYADSIGIKHSMFEFETWVEGLVIKLPMGYFKP